MNLARPHESCDDADSVPKRFQEVTYCDAVGDALSERFETAGGRFLTWYRCSFHLSYDPTKFDPRFADQQYMMTEQGKSRLKGYLRTFIYMSVCGALLVLGGGVFFIHESLTMQHHEHSGDGNRESVSKQNKHRSFDYAATAAATYAKELRIVGYVFFGLGTLFLIIGLPLTYQFWKRYQRAKEMERFPMLDPMYQKQLENAYYTSPTGRRVSQRQEARESKRFGLFQLTKSISKKSCWSFSRQPKVTDEQFRVKETSSMLDDEIESSSQAANDVGRQSSTKSTRSSLFSNMLLQEIDEELEGIPIHITGFNNDAAILMEEEEEEEPSGSIEKSANTKDSDSWKD